MRRGLVLCLIAFGLTSAPALTAPKASCARPDHPGGEWRWYGHDYSNSRTQPAEKKIGLPEAAQLQPAWYFSAEEAGGSGDFTGTPVIADGCVYMGSNDAWVFAMNADTGELVWKTRVDKRGGINSSLAIIGGRVFASVSRIARPYAVALDQQTGHELWRTTLDTQPGSDIYSSPVVYDGFVVLGVSGGAAELGDEADRHSFQGNYSLIEMATGEVLHKEWTIRPPDKNVNKPKDDYAGAAVWSSAAVDTATKTGYLVSGNPFRPQAEHKHTNAILKIDFDRASPRFGRIIAAYKGTVDEYFPAIGDLPCYDIPGNPPPYYPQGIGACQDLDMDFGASPNLFEVDGKKVVGAGQKSGVYHVADRTSMEGVWKTIVGPPSAVGGIVGSTAFNGDAIFGPITVPGYLWSLNSSGGHRWISPIGDGAHWGNPVSVANGVVYTVDLRGFLTGYDAATGAPVFASPLWSSGGSGLKLSWGGVSIARNMVYAAVGITGGDGFIFGYSMGET
ncbi:MAG: PQQ-binding-like beta-propeller repeat protein [Actinomycetota bacterium]